jgi:hypothetical protein
MPRFSVSLSCRAASKVSSISCEDNNMNRFLILSALALSTLLIGPVVARAQDGNHQEKRYYDRNGKDYHTWNNTWGSSTGVPLASGGWKLAYFGNAANCGFAFAGRGLRAVFMTIDRYT